MLRFGNSINHLTVTSLQIGYPVATTIGPIINPHNLTVLGFYCESTEVPAPAVLLTQSIRELSGHRIIIDNAEEIVAAEELIRDQDSIRINYQLTDKKVITERKQKLGKVEDYVINDETFVIQKIHVARSGIQGFSGGKLIIDRSQIVETNDKHIVVKDAAVKVGSSPRLATTPS